MSDYNYRRSLKSDLSDELINTYLMRPLAGILVRLLYHTPVSPNMVTFAAIAAGLLAALFYLQGSSASMVVAGLLVSVKDILDSADGQLARARNQFSRRGRFLDSIGDIVVTLAIFAAIGQTLYRATNNSLVFLLSAASALGMTLRVSYHVFYQVSYLHMHDAYAGNRLIEVITEEDRRGDRFTLTLHRIFLVLYGWQDRLMLRIDQWCRTGLGDEFREAWYADRVGMRLSGFLGYGTELFLLMLASVGNQVEVYLWVNVVGMNALLAGAIVYRRLVLRQRLQLTKPRGASAGVGTDEASRESLQ